MRGSLPLKADDIMDVKIKMFTCDGDGGMWGADKAQTGMQRGWVGGWD